MRLALAGGAVAATGFVGARVSGRVRRRELTVTLPGLPPAFGGFRIGVISDIHRSTLVSEEHCRVAASLLEDAPCDLVLNLGDNVTALEAYAPSALRGLRRLHPPAGKFAVLGNHDHWTNATQVRLALEKVGFRLLNNEHAAVKRGDQALYLVGIDDLWAGRPDFEAAFRGVPDEGCVIVLSHNPDAIKHATVKRAGLVLAGHTHGGQVLGCNRLVPNCEYGRTHPHGLYREGTCQIYVTSGVGVIFPPIRLGVPAEVVVITLRG